MRSSHAVLAPLLSGLLFFSAARAQFGAQQQFFCESPETVDLADFDGDGALDLIVASRQGLGFYRNQDGEGDFAQPTYLGTLETVACAADVNGDALTDVIASRADNHGLVVFLNTGNGTFGDAVEVAPDISASEIHAADLDNDGDQDIYFVTLGGSLAWCINGDGFGTFTAPAMLADLAQMAYAQAVDIDADGDLDLTFSSRVMNEVDVCFNDNGWFGPQQQLTINGHGSASDIDGDGHVDVMVANTAAGLVGWQRNSSDGASLEMPDLLDQAFNAPEHITASDLDGDGDRDAIVTSGAASEVAWYENTDGQGNYGPRETVCFGVPVTAIATGDVDGDGDKDLFVASSELGKVIWYTNMANATGKIMGRVFNDIDGDGTFNGNDHGLVNKRVDCGDLGATYTNASGYYWFDAVPATYSVMKPAESGWQFTTVDEYSATIPVQGVSQHNDFGLQAAGPISELTPDIGSAPMRCATDISYWATVSNTGNQVSDVRLRLDLDALSAFVAADPAPDEVVDGVATWNFASLQPTHQRQVHIVVHLPGSEYVGQVLNDAIEATALVDGSPISTDTKVYSPLLLCAVDPNDKHVLPVGEGSAHLTPMGTKLYYNIRFQNTGNAMAERVILVDTLDADLDPTSLEIQGSSHAMHTLLLPDGTLRFTFEGIDLPDSGSDYLGSQGFVRFAIKHLGTIPEGTVVNNTAHIFFDNNAAVVTNTTMNTFTFGTLTGVEETDPQGGSITVFPNPAQGTTTVRIGDGFVGRVDVQLFNAAGSMVRQLTRRSSTILLEQGALPQGVYLLRATDERGTERVTRLAFE